MRITALAISMLPFFLSCSIDDIGTHYIAVKMVGVYEEPRAIDASEVSKRFEPISQTFELRKIIVTNEIDGVISDKVLFGEDETSKTFRITNQQQKILNYKMSNEDYKMKITATKIIWANQVEGVSKLNSDHQILLDATKDGAADFELDYNETVEAGEGQGIDFTIKIKWKKTVLRDGDPAEDTMFAPTFDVSAQKS